MAQHSLLATIERRFGKKQRRIYDFAIRWFRPVLRIEVERIHHSFLAGGLNNAASPEVAAPSEVVLQRDAPPVIDSHGRKGGVVVAMAKTCRHGDVARDLSGTGHCADRKVESRRSASGVQVSPEA